MTNFLQPQKPHSSACQNDWQTPIFKKLALFSVAALFSAGTAFAQDATAPSLKLKNIKVNLDSNGQAIISPNQLNNGTTDNVTAANNIKFNFGSEQTVCGMAGEGAFVNLQAPAGQMFWDVKFASYGSVTGNCNSGFTAGSCNASNSMSVVRNLLVGKSSVYPQGIKASNDIFGDPCWGTAKSLAISAAYTMDELTFNSSNLGHNTVTVTATDEAGNLTSGTATITVVNEDITAPTLVLKNIEVHLDANGQVIVTPDQLNNGTSDDFTTSNNIKFTFGSEQTICGMAGEGAFVNLQAPAGQMFWDVKFASYGSVTGNCNSGFTAGSCNASNSMSVVRNLLVGKSSVYPQGIKASNDIFGDPCWGTAKSLAISAAYTVNDLTFTGHNLGNNTVTVIATDEAGNYTIGTAIVKVIGEDLIAPTMALKNIRVTLDQNGQATVTPDQLNNGTTDNFSLPNKIKFTFGSEQTICGMAGEGAFVNLQAPAGQMFWDVKFASYGSVTGNCNSGFTAGSCNASNSMSVVRNLLVGKSSVYPQGIKASNDIFGDPCWGTAKSLAISAAYTVNDLAFNGSNLGTNNVTVIATDEAGNYALGTAVITVEGNPFMHQTARLAGAAVKQEATFKAFPNPFSGSANLEFTLEQAGNFRAELVDIRGAVVKVIGAGEGEINKLYSYGIEGNNLSSGVYFVRLTSGDGVKHLKVVLN